MLAKKYKLPLPLSDKKSQRRLQTPFFVIKVFPPEKEYSRFAVIINKQLVAGAAKRNRLKRLIFEGCRRILRKWPRADYLVIIKSQPNEQTISTTFS